MELQPGALLGALEDDLSAFSTSQSVPLLDPDCSAREFSSDVDSRSVASWSLRRSLLKKFEPVGQRDISLRDKAVAKFLECNERCRTWVLPKSLNNLVQKMRLIAQAELSALPDWQHMLQALETGPGASVGSQGRNSAYEKLFSNIATTTSFQLYAEYVRFMCQVQEWHDAEAARRAHLLPGPHVLGVVGSALTTVAKNREIDRTISSQPSVNMLFQKALSKRFEEVLRREYHWLNDKQPVWNREMTRLGSLGSGHCTIDLESASDTINLSLLSLVFPNDWVAAILDCRTDVIEVDGVEHTLHMVSTMGNGFTFTMMTYLISLVIKAVAIESGVKWTPYDRKVFGVFGDDVVVPQELYEPVCCALTGLGFIPNLKKSYAAGLFRESCGEDWWNGNNVRGVYIKSLSGRCDIYSAINRLLRWSTRWGIPLPKTIDFLLRGASNLSDGLSRRPYLVPPFEADTAGIHVPMFMARASSGYTILSPRKKILRLYNKRGSRDEAFRHYIRNPLGVLMCASVGWLASNGIVRKEDETVFYDPVWKPRVPIWDTPDDYRISHNLSYDRWTAVVWSHITT